MSVSSTSPAIPMGINAFFETIYGAAPNVSEDKKNTVYSHPEKNISIITDKFGGCHIDVKGEVEHLGKAQQAIWILSETLRANKVFDSFWVDFALPTNPCILGSLIPAPFILGKPGEGDLIYDYQQKKLRVWQWLNEDKACTIPVGATHNIGATALMLDLIARKVLLVVNVMRNTAWNLPGGSFDPLKDKTPRDTALREAEEEGGFTLPKDVEYVSKLVGQAQFPNNQFAPAISQVWVIFVNGMCPIALNPPKDEIVKAEWVSIDEIFASNGTLRGYKLSEEIIVPLHAAVDGKGFDLIADKGWMITHAPQMDEKASARIHGCLI